MFTTRRATVEDVEKLTQLRLDLFRENGDISGEASPELVEITRNYLRDHLPTGQFISFVAEADGEIVAISGMVFLQKPPNEVNRSGLEAYIMNMYTLPEWRGQGIASQLIKDLLVYAKAAGARRVWLRTTEDGRPVYENNGFVYTKDDMEYHII